MKTYDLVVIGGGPAGNAAALGAANQGKSVALVEREHVGGTCANRGCIPTKALLFSSSLYEQMKEAELYGLSAPELSYSWDGIIAKMIDVVETQRKGSVRSVKHKNLDLIEGSGVLHKDNVVAVTPNDGSEEFEISGEKVVLAVGAKPIMPPIPGLEHAVSSDEILEGKIGEPSSIVIIGGGIIGIEFATFFAQLDIPVTVIEALPSILSTMDNDVVKAHTSQLKKQGAQLLVGHKVVGVEPNQSGDGFVVKAENDKGETVEASGEVVLCAVGRASIANEVIGDDLEVEMNRSAVVTNDQFETSVPNVYALGDAVAGNVQLAHVASMDGARFVAQVYGGGKSDEPAIPSCVYTYPEIAQIGLTQEQYEEQGKEAVSVRSPLGGNARSVIAGDPRSFIKLVADANSGKLVGAIVYAAHATELIDEMAVTIAAEMTVDEALSDVMRPHPTYAESFDSALEALKAKLN